MYNWDFQALEAFDRTALEELGKFLGEVDNQAYARAAELIVAAQKRGNRVHITGIGKPGHVSEYGASLLSSTGTITRPLEITRHFAQAFTTESAKGSCMKKIQESAHF